MALLVTQKPTIAGVTPTYAAASGGGDTLTASTYGYLQVKNTSGAPITVTVVDPRTDSITAAAYTDPTISIPATTGDKIIYIDPKLADPTTGLVNLTYSGVTNLTVGYFSVL